jgi:hypothetical protein
MFTLLVNKYEYAQYSLGKKRQNIILTSIAQFREYCPARGGGVPTLVISWVVNTLPTLLWPKPSIIFRKNFHRHSKY